MPTSRRADQDVGRVLELGSQEPPPPSLKLSEPPKESHGLNLPSRAVGWTQDSGPRRAEELQGEAGWASRRGKKEPQSLLPAGGRIPTSFPPSLVPYQALWLGAMATGPKQLKKSLGESHAGCHSCHQPQPGTSDTHQRGSPGSSQRRRPECGKGQPPAKEATRPPSSVPAHSPRL